jgi:hypothetical protein
MAIEKGEEKTGKEEKIPVSQDKLYEMVLQLQKELKESQSSKTPQAAWNPEDVAKLVAETIKATNQNKDSIDVNYERGIDESQIPADDYLGVKGGITFFAPCGGYVIADDIRKGQRVLLPYGKKFVFFENPAVTKIQKGKYEELLVISKYTSFSKKEVEWLRKHRLFGFKFHESIGQTVNADVVRMQKLARIMGNVQNYDIADLLKHATTYKVPVSEDYDSVRHGLATALLEREEAVDAEIRTRTFLDNSKDRMLFEKMNA